jgi:hypothetical protein
MYGTGLDLDSPHRYRQYKPERDIALSGRYNEQEAFATLTAHEGRRGDQILGCGWLKQSANWLKFDRRGAIDQAFLFRRD